MNALRAGSSASAGAARGSRGAIDAALAAGSLGVTLRVLEFAGRRSVFSDEAAVALNLRSRSFLQLLGPLDYAQTAPPGYLWAQKLVALVFGTGEAALRVLPLLVGCATLYLVYRIGRHAAGQWAAAAAVFFFGVAEPAVYYSASMKPYAFDLFASAAATVLTLRASHGKLTRREVAMLALGGLALLPWSQQVVLVLSAGALGVVLTGGSWKAGIVALTWWIGCAAAILFARAALPPGTAGYMHEYWSAGFMPWSAPAAGAWLVSALFAVPYAVQGFAWPLVIMAHVLFVVGVVAVRSGRRWLLLAPLCGALAGAAAHAYPFGVVDARIAFMGRVVLFLAPSVSVLFGAGAVALWRVSRLRSISRAAVLLAGAGAAAPALTYVPHRHEDVKPTLRYVLRHWRPGDRTYVYYSAFLLAEYYRRPLGLDRLRFVQGHCHVRPSDYVAELAGLGPGRTWVVVAHAHTPELRLLRRYVQLLGPVLADTVTPRLGDWPSTETGATLVDIKPMTERALAEITNALSSEATGACGGLFAPVTEVTAPAPPPTGSTRLAAGWRRRDPQSLSNGGPGPFQIRVAPVASTRRAHA